MVRRPYNQLVQQTEVRDMSQRWHKQQPEAWLSEWEQEVIRAPLGKCCNCLCDARAGSKWNVMLPLGPCAVSA